MDEVVKLLNPQEFIITDRYDGYTDLYIPSVGVHIVYNSDRVIQNLEDVLKAFKLNTVKLDMSKNYTIDDLIRIFVKDEYVEEYRKYKDSKSNQFLPHDFENKLDIPEKFLNLIYVSESMNAERVVDEDAEEDILSDDSIEENFEASDFDMMDVLNDVISDMDYDSGHGVGAPAGPAVGPVPVMGAPGPARRNVNIEDVIKGVRIYYDRTEFTSLNFMLVYNRKRYFYPYNEKLIRTDKGKAITDTGIMIYVNGENDVLICILYYNGLTKKKDLQRYRDDYNTFKNQKDLDTAEGCDKINKSIQDGIKKYEQMKQDEIDRRFVECTVGADNRGMIKVNYNKLESENFNRADFRIQSALLKYRSTIFKHNPVITQNKYGDVVIIIDNTYYFLKQDQLSDLCFGLSANGNNTILYTFNAASKQLAPVSSKRKSSIKNLVSYEDITNELRYEYEGVEDKVKKDDRTTHLYKFNIEKKHNRTKDSEIEEIKIYKSKSLYPHNFLIKYEDSIWKCDKHEYILKKGKGLELEGKFRLSFGCVYDEDTYSISKAHAITRFDRKGNTQYATNELVKVKAEDIDMTGYEDITEHIKKNVSENTITFYYDELFEPYDLKNDELEIYTKYTDPKNVAVVLKIKDKLFDISDYDIDEGAFNKGYYSIADYRICTLGNPCVEKYDGSAWVKYPASVVDLTDYYEENSLIIFDPTPDQCFMNLRIMKRISETYDAVDDFSKIPLYEIPSERNQPAKYYIIYKGHRVNLKHNTGLLSLYGLYDFGDTDKLENILISLDPIINNRISLNGTYELNDRCDLQKIQVCNVLGFEYIPENNHKRLELGTDFEIIPVHDSDRYFKICRVRTGYDETDQNNLLDIVDLLVNGKSSLILSKILLQKFGINTEEHNYYVFSYNDVGSEKYIVVLTMEERRPSDTAVEKLYFTAYGPLEGSEDAVIDIDGISKNVKYYQYGLMQRSSDNSYWVQRAASGADTALKPYDFNLFENYKNVTNDFLYPLPKIKRYNRFIKNTDCTDVVIPTPEPKPAPTPELQPEPQPEPAVPPKPQPEPTPTPASESEPDVEAEPKTKSNPALTQHSDRIEIDFSNPKPLKQYILTENTSTGVQVQAPVSLNPLVDSSGSNSESHAPEDDAGTTENQGSQEKSELSDSSEDDAGTPIPTTSPQADNSEPQPVQKSTSSGSDSNDTKDTSINITRLSSSVSSDTEQSSEASDAETNTKQDNNSASEPSGDENSSTPTGETGEQNIADPVSVFSDSSDTEHPRDNPATTASAKIITPEPSSLQNDRYDSSDFEAYEKHPDRDFETYIYFNSELSASETPPKPEEPEQDGDNTKNDSEDSYSTPDPIPVPLFGTPAPELIVSQNPDDSTGENDSDPEVVIGEEEDKPEPQPIPEKKPTYISPAVPAMVPVEEVKFDEPLNERRNVPLKVYLKEHQNPYVKHSGFKIVNVYGSEKIVRYVEPAYTSFNWKLLTTDGKGEAVDHDQTDIISELWYKPVVNTIDEDGIKIDYKVLINLINNEYDLTTPVYICKEVTTGDKYVYTYYVFYKHCIYKISNIYNLDYPMFNIWIQDIGSNITAYQIGSNEEHKLDAIKVNSITEVELDSEFRSPSDDSTQSIFDISSSIYTLEMQEATGGYKILVPIIDAMYTYERLPEAKSSTNEYEDELKNIPEQLLKISASGVLEANYDSNATFDNPRLNMDINKPYKTSTRVGEFMCPDGSGEPDGYKLKLLYLPYFIGFEPEFEKLKKPNLTDTAWEIRFNEVIPKPKLSNRDVKVCAYKDNDKVVLVIKCYDLYYPVDEIYNIQYPILNVVYQAKYNRLAGRYEYTFYKWNFNNSYTPYRGFYEPILPIQDLSKIPISELRDVTNYFETSNHTHDIYTYNPANVVEANVTVVSPNGKVIDLGRATEYNMGLTQETYTFIIFHSRKLRPGHIEITYNSVNNYIFKSFKKRNTIQAQPSPAAETTRTNPEESNIPVVNPEGELSVDDGTKTENDSESGVPETTESHENHDVSGSDTGGTPLDDISGDDGDAKTENDFDQMNSENISASEPDKGTATGDPEEQQDSDVLSASGTGEQKKDPVTPSAEQDQDDMLSDSENTKEMDSNEFHKAVDATAYDDPSYSQELIEAVKGQDQKPILSTTCKEFMKGTSIGLYCSITQEKDSIEKLDFYVCAQLRKLTDEIYHKVNIISRDENGYKLDIALKIDKSEGIQNVCIINKANQTQVELKLSDSEDPQPQLVYDLYSLFEIIPNINDKCSYCYIKPENYLNMSVNSKERLTQFPSLNSVSEGDSSAPPAQIPQLVQTEPLSAQSPPAQPVQAQQPQQSPSNPTVVGARLVQNPAFKQDSILSGGSRITTFMKFLIYSLLVLTIIVLIIYCIRKYSPATVEKFTGLKSSFKALFI